MDMFLELLTAAVIFAGYWYLTDVVITSRIKKHFVVYTWFVVSLIVNTVTIFYNQHYLLNGIFEVVNIYIIYVESKYIWHYFNAVEKAGIEIQDSLLV